MRKLAIVTVLLAWAASAAAQETPADSEVWVVSGSLSESYIDNLFLIEDGPGDWITNATVSLAYFRQRPPNSFSAYGWVGGSYFDRFDVYNGLKYGLGFAGENGLDRRARVRWSGAFADGLNRKAFYDGRLGLPEIDVKSGYAATGLDYDFTPSTTGRLSADLSGVHYRLDARELVSIAADFLSPPSIANPVDPGIGNPELAPLILLEQLALEGFLVRDLDYWTWHFGGGLSHEFSENTQGTLDLGVRSSTTETIGVPDGRLYDASVNLNHKLDPSAGVSLGYVYQHADYDRVTQTHTVFARAQKEFSEKVHGDVTAGVTHLDGPSDETSSWNFVGGAGLTLRLKHTSLAARASRSVYQGVVAGRRQIADEISGSASHVFGKRVFAAAYLSYRNAQDTELDVYSSEQLFGGAALSLRLSERFWLTPTYGYALYDRGLLGQSPSRQSFGLSLSYSKAFK